MSDILRSIDRSQIEVMAPVGSYESLHAAIEAKADSIYFGVEGLNMRAASSANFTLEDLANIVSICRQNGVKTYLTVNTVIYDEDLPKMREILDRAKKEEVSAVILSDQAALMYAHSIGLSIHLSTQLNISNIESVKFYSRYADVVVLARELNIWQVEEIYKQIQQQQIKGPSGELVRIEMFAHGALCMAVSGKCYLSLHDAGVSANRGSCRQICRRSYHVTDNDTGAELIVENQYIMSPKDLCTIGFLDKFIGAGVRVLKIEGRARSGEYVKRVCECYNQAIDSVLDGTFTPDKVEKWTEKLSTVFNRGFWDGYYMGAKLGEWSNAYGSSATKKKVYVGKITNFFSNLSVAEVLIETGELRTGDDILVLGETTGVLEQKAGELRVDLKVTEVACKGEKCSLVTDKKVRRGDKLYIEIENNKK